MHIFTIAFSVALAMGPNPTHLPPLRQAVQPLMMASPLKFRERSRNALSAARGMLKGVVVSSQNMVLQYTPASRLIDDPVGRGDDEETPAILSDEICLVPGRPVVRVEVAPGNARRIFTGIDIVVEGEDALDLVWGTLTDYANLAEGIPNLVDNQVLSRTENGARLKQLGGATLAPGITFTASTTLDVVEYPQGLPAEMEADHLMEDVEEEGGMPSSDSAALRKHGEALPLMANIFPRPYIISKLPRTLHVPALTK